MPVVALNYVPLVSSGKASGIEVSVSNKDPLDFLPKFGPKAMNRRLNKLMEVSSVVMKQYITAQYETGGRGFSSVASKIGVSGGSLDAWAPLELSTKQHRKRGYGYYRGLPGSGDTPRLWSTRSLIVAQQAIQVSANSLNINISDAISAIQERTRPVFVITEIAALVKGIAVQLFKPLSGKGDAFVHTADGPLNITVGEAKPFDFGDAPRGRPKLSGEQRLLRDILKGSGFGP